MNWEQSTAKGYQVVFILPTDDKANPSLFTDKQAIQEVKTKRGGAKQLKPMGSFKLCSLCSWWIHSCWSLYVRLGLLGAVSRTIMTLPGFELPERNAAHTGLPWLSFGFDSSTAALGYFEYFGYPLSLSFHEHSIPVNSLTLLLGKWHRWTNKICDILVYYSASSVNLLMTFREKNFGLISFDLWRWNIQVIPKRRNKTEDCSSQLLSRRSLKSSRAITESPTERLVAHWLHA
jgi:hypothetical protein